MFTNLQTVTVCLGKMYFECAAMPHSVNAKLIHVIEPISAFSAGEYVRAC